jgi:hypothetical protein
LLSGMVTPDARVSDGASRIDVACIAVSPK